MPSTTKKGNIFESEVRGILEKMGWKVEGQHRKVGWILDRGKPYINGKPPLKMIMVGRDIFGCDVIAKKSGEKTLYIQVSVHSAKSNKIKQVMNEPWNFAHDTVQLWLRREGKREFEIYEAPTFVFLGTYNMAAQFIPNASLRSV